MALVRQLMLGLVRKKILPVADAQEIVTAAIAAIDTELAEARITAVGILKGLVKELEDASA